MEHVANNYKSTTKTKKNRSNQAGCKEDNAADPIQISTGAKTDSLTLFALPGEMGLYYELNYVSDAGGWRDSLGYYIDTWPCDPSADSCSRLALHRPDGSTVMFHGANSANPQKPEIGGNGLITLTQQPDGSYVLQDEDATTQVYDVDGNLVSLRDATGIGWSLSHSYNIQTQTATTVVTHTSGRSFTVISQAANINGATWYNMTITDPAGNVYRYVASLFSYGGDKGQISSVSLPGPPATTIAYK